MADAGLVCGWGGSDIFIEGGLPGGMEYLLRERGLPFPGKLLKYMCKMKSFKAI